MSEFIDDEGDEPQVQELIEVEVDAPNEPISDDESTAPGEEQMEGEEHQFQVTDAPDLSYAVFPGHSDNAYCVAIHPTIPGLVITGGGDDMAYIWKYRPSAPDVAAPMDVLDDSVPNNTASIASTQQGEIESAIELGGHKDTVTSVGFNFNGNLALTGGYDGTIRIWDVSSGNLMQVLEGPEDIEWAQWHMKGNAVVAGSRDGTIWMWLTHNGQCVHVFAGHDGGVPCGLFTVDGKMICTGGEDGTIRQWQPKTGVCRHVFGTTAGVNAGHEAGVTCLASGGADGDLLISGSSDGTVKLYQVNGKRLLQTFTHSEETSAAGAMETIAEEASASTNDNNQGVEQEEGEEDEEEGGEASAVLGVECVGFSHSDLKWVASGGMDKSLKVWDTVSGSLRCACVHGGSVVALKWHQTLPIVCTAALDGVIRLWDARNGSLLKEFTGHQDIVTNLDMKPNPARAAALVAGNAVSTAASVADSIEDATDIIVSVSDDHTARVFLVDVRTLGF